MYNSFEFTEINLSIFKDEKLQERKKAIFSEHNITYYTLMN